MMRPEIYFTVHDWMIHKMELKHSELLIFAYIYAYTKFDPSGQGFVDNQHISFVLDLDLSNTTVLTRRLHKKGFLELKKEHKKFNRCQYRVNIKKVSNLVFEA